MKIFKFSSLMLFAVLMMSAFAPNLNAKTYTSFSFNLNVDPAPRYVAVAPPPPAYTVVRPYAPAAVVQERVYYPSYYQEVVVRRPYAERVYVHPHHAYWRY